MGFGDMFSKKKEYGGKKRDGGSPPMASSSNLHKYNLPDPRKYPMSHVLTKRLITQGYINWGCCKCGFNGNVFSVPRDELDNDSLAEPFFLWGDAFCEECAHSFCYVCIERVQ